MNSTNSTLYIVKKRTTILEAYQAAMEEYNAFFQEFHPYINRATHTLLREIFAPEGKVAYYIRIEVAVNEQTVAAIPQWAEKHIVCDVPVNFENIMPLNLAK